MHFHLPNPYKCFGGTASGKKSLGYRNTQVEVYLFDMNTIPSLQTIPIRVTIIRHNITNQRTYPAPIAHGSVHCVLQDNATASSKICKNILFIIVILNIIYLNIKRIYFMGL